MTEHGQILADEGAGLEKLARKPSDHIPSIFYKDLSTMPFDHAHATKKVDKHGKTQVNKVMKQMTSPLKKHEVSAVMKGFRHKSGNPESLFMWPLLEGAEKLSPKKTKDLVWKVIGKPLLTADTTVGHHAAKIPLLGKLFRVTEKVPLSKGKAGLFREIQRSSALGPLTKLHAIAAPIIVGYALDKGLEKIRQMKDNPGAGAFEGSKAMDDKKLREKVASAMLQLHKENEGHRKRAQSMRLLYKQAELGYGQIPQTYGELEEKLASLDKQDLVVLEKALEITGGNIKLGELGREDPLSLTDPVSIFQAAVMGDEI